MRKITFFKTIMLAILTLLASVSYGQTSTITITMATIDPTNALATNAYNSGAERTWTQNSVSFGGKAICPNAANSPVNPTPARTYIQAQANNGVIYNTTPLPGKIVSITLNQGGTAQSSSCYGGTERLVNTTAANYDVTNGTGVGTANSAGWTSTDFTDTDYNFFAIKRSTGTSYFESIVIEYETPSVSQVELPVISPSGGTFNAPVTVSITCATSGATIYYTTDGSNPTATSLEYTTSFEVSTTTTVKAIAMMAGMTNSAIASQTYNIVAAGEEKTYSLVTSTGDLVAGAKYLIVSASDGSANAMAQRNTANNRRVAAVNIVSGSITTTPATIDTDVDIPFEITLGGSTGAWTLYDEVLDGYLKANSSTANNMPTTPGEADWTISFNSDNSAVLTCTTGDFGRNIIRYNSANTPPLMSCYASGQNPVYLFKEVSESSVETPVISPASGNFDAPINVTITCATTGATIYYTTDGLTPTATSLEYTTSFEVSTTTTVKAIAILAGESSNVASATYTFPPTVPNIAAYLASTQTGNVKISGPVAVTYQNGQYLFVQDDSGYLLVFGTIGKSFNNGDIITGLMGTLSPYHGLPEMTNATVPDATSGSPIDPYDYILANFVISDISRYVKVSNVQFTTDVNFASATPANTGYLVSPENFVVYNRFNNPISVSAGTNYDITGLISYFDAPQLFYISIAPATPTGDITLSDIIKIYSNNGNIVVDNAKAGDKIEVYNVTGQIILNSIAAEGKNTITVDSRGVLIVRCGDKISKIIL
ncbi:MAG: chitobiase/beta-hexosaminidase C-terminal domain-containing protein [Paludibacter sp.]|nr:chitobiase/beta-hexosaminidase C-terminal domain-containing protein [Paludibacter sp.]